MNKDNVQSVIDAVHRMNDEHGIDVIDGVRVRDVVGDVMLEVAFSPVIPHPVTGEFDMYPPEPQEAIALAGGDYGVVVGIGQDAHYQTVSPEELRLMRARFLLLRDHFYGHLRHMGHAMRQQVLAMYFPKGVWLPEEGSELAKAMGV